MKYAEVASKLRELKILVIARGTTFKNSSLTMYSTPLKEELSDFRTQETALFQAIADVDIITQLYFDALVSAACLCIDPDSHRLSWHNQDRVVCHACRELRDVYFYQLAKTPARTTELRPDQAGSKILQFHAKTG